MPVLEQEEVTTDLLPDRRREVEAIRLNQEFQQYLPVVRSLVQLYSHIQDAEEHLPGILFDHFNTLHSNADTAPRRHPRSYIVRQLRARAHDFAAKRSPKADTCKPLLNEAVIELPGYLKGVFILRYYEGLTPDDAAKQLKISPREARRRLTIALNFLRQVINA